MGILTLCMFLFQKHRRVLLRLEAVLVRDSEATHSADLGTSSKESY
jgi:hypothetical protein